MAFKKFTSSEEMLKPDARFNSKLVSKFINCLMWSGKKTVAQGIVYGALDNIAKKNNLDPAKVDIVNMAPNLQEQMLIRGDVDISALFTATSYMNLVALTLDPDNDFRWIYYSD